MNDFSLVEKLNVLMNIILSSPLFLFCCMMGVAVLILFIICIKGKVKVNKWIFIVIWFIIFFVMIFNYNDIFINLIDALFDSVFMALYFPSITIYIAFVSIINLVFLYSLISKKTSKSNKIISFICALIIDILLILIVDIINTNNVNIYDSLAIYTNSNLLVLFQLTSAIFVSWILLSLLSSAHKKLKKYDKKVYPKMPEIVFEDI